MIWKIFHFVCGVSNVRIFVKNSKIRITHWNGYVWVWLWSWLNMPHSIISHYSCLYKCFTWRGFVSFYGWKMVSVRHRTETDSHRWNSIDVFHLKTFLHICLSMVSIKRSVSTMKILWIEKYRCEIMLIWLEKYLNF